MANLSLSGPGSYRRTGTVVLAAVVGLSFAASAFAAVPAVYRARMFTGGGAGSAAAVNARIVVDATTTVEEAARLNESIGRGDWDAFLAVFRSTPKGSIQFTGSAGLKIPCYIVSEEATPEGGTRLIMVAQGQPIDPFATRRFFGSFVFLIVRLDVDAAGKGEGKAYDEASFRFTPDGKVVPEGSMSTPKVFTNVRRDK